MGDTSRSTFAATGIVVDDLERSLAFYRDVMGMQELQRFDVPEMHLEEIVVGFGGRGAAVVLMRSTASAPEPLAKGFGGKLVFYVDDPAAIAASVTAAGGTVTREPAPWAGGGLLGFVEDPDGHLLELLQLKPRSA